MSTVKAMITIEGRVWIAAGNAPFMVEPIEGKAWMVTGRDGDNCLASPVDSLRGVFDQEQPACLLCEQLNERAAR